MPIKKKNPPAKNPVGRPTKYKDEMLDILIECGKKGFTKTMMVVELGINRDTLYAWTNINSPHYNEEFSVAYKQAEELSQAFMERKGMDNMENPKFKEGIYRYFMQRRFPKDWGDLPQININHNTSQELTENEREIINTITTNLNNNKNYDAE